MQAYSYGCTEHTVGFSLSGVHISILDEFCFSRFCLWFLLSRKLHYFDETSYIETADPVPGQTLSDKMSKPETTHVLDKETSSASNGSQEVFEQKPTFGQKAKAIFKKFWWAFLIVLCVGVVVVTVPL
jgi:hypothetical protein